MTAPTTGSGDADQDDPGDEATLAVPFPGLDELLHPYRRDLDPITGIGIPPHVTILHPFAPPGTLDDADLAWLRDLFAATPEFSCRFVRTRWFSDQVLWLEPEPATEFRRLTRAVSERFPDHPPYGGAYPDITPHLTLATRAAEGDPALAAAALDRLRQAERGLTALLPVTLPADRVSLMCGGADPGGWRSVLDFPFGQPAVPA